MKTLFFRFVLKLIVVCFCFTAPELASGSTPPRRDNASPNDWQHDNRRYARSLANADVGEPRTVRLIYFLPNDKDFRAEVVQRMKDEIRRIQVFYREQMQAHGKGARTFRVETDAQGEPVVHRVDGQHRNIYYQKSDVAGTTLAEIEPLFDVNANIYLIVIDNHGSGIGPPIGFQGLGSKRNKIAGFALLPGEFTFIVAAHELGHTFGLHHNFHDDAYIMSYGQERDELSRCSANFLAVHPYFNSDVPVDDVIYDHEIELPTDTDEFDEYFDLLDADRRLYPTVEFFSPRQYPIGAKSVTLQLNISDSNGVHHALLYVFTETPHNAAGYPEVFSCRELAGEKNPVVKFEYDGVIASSGVGSLSHPTTHPIFIEAVDIHGNVSVESVRLYEATPGHIATFAEHEDPVHSLVFSPNGRTLASASYDNRVILWDVEMGNMISVLHNGNPFRDAPSSLAFSPDGDTLAVGLSGYIMFWDVRTRERIDTILWGDQVFTYRTSCLAFSPDGRILTSGGDKAIRLWDANTRENVGILEGHTSGVSSLVFSPDGTTLASGSSDATIKLWNLETEKNIATLEGHIDGIRSISFSHDGRILASAGHDFTLKLWDIETTQILASIGGRHAPVNRTLFSPVENILAFGHTDIKLLDLETGARIATFGIAGVLDELAFSRDGEKLAAATSIHEVTSTIELWDTTTWTSLRNQMIPDTSLRAVLRTFLDKEAESTITQEDLAMLTHFTAHEVSIFGLVGLEFATNLQRLNLHGNNIIDLSPIARLNNLHTLFLGNNTISDISPLKGLTNLTDLYLYDNHTISDISPLKGLTNLTTLYLGNNNISDLSPLSALVNLSSLFLAGNKLSDTSALSGLTNLRTLHLAVNSISDISPLLANSGLGEGDTLFLRRNPLNYEAVDSHIPLLQDRGVTVSFIDRTPTTLEPVAGDEQQGVPSALLQDPFVVEVRDEHGDVFEGVPVTFNVPEGSGRLSATTTTTDADGRAQSVLTLGQRTGTIAVTVAAAEIAEMVTFTVVSEATPPRTWADVNGDGVVNIQDLVLVGFGFNNDGRDDPADVNRDGVVNIQDLVLVAAAFAEAAAAPSAHLRTVEQLSASDVRQWLNEARSLKIQDATVQEGILALEQLLAFLTPKETALLPNYPNPFNPETWIPYRLANEAEVEITIYDTKGVPVRRLKLGHQLAGHYSEPGRATYWDGRNENGESVASGVYFYRLRAGDYAASKRMVIVK